MNRETENSQSVNKTWVGIGLLAVVVILLVVFGRDLLSPEDGTAPAAQTLEELTQKSQAPSQEEFFTVTGVEYPLDERAVISGFSYDDETEEEIKLQGFDYFSYEDKESVFARWTHFAAGQPNWAVESQTENTLIMSDETRMITVTVIEETETGTEVEVVFADARE